MPRRREYRVAFAQFKSLAPWPLSPEDKVRTLTVPELLQVLGIRWPRDLWIVIDRHQIPLPTARVSGAYHWRLHELMNHVREREGLPTDPDTPPDTLNPPPPLASRDELSDFVSSMLRAVMDEVRPRPLPFLVDVKWMVQNLGRSRVWFEKEIKFERFPSPDYLLGNTRKWKRETVLRWLERQSIRC